MTDGSTHRIDGRLTSDEVPDVWRRSKRWQADGVPEVVDLADVDAADSSGVALLLEWRAWAKAQDRPIRFENAPESLRTIAALSQVEGLLGWEDEKE